MRTTGRGPKILGKIAADAPSVVLGLVLSLLAAKNFPFYGEMRIPRWRREKFQEFRERPLRLAIF